MNVALTIAKRYLFSRKNRSAINIISAIAALGVTIGSLAMVIVLSAFNGLESLVGELYTSVDPDIRIGVLRGKTLDLDSVKLSEFSGWQEIAAVGPTLEETVFLQYENQQSVATIRGIHSSYLPQLKLDSFLIEGDLKLEFDSMPGAILGYGIADNLNLFVDNAFERIKVYAAKRHAEKSMNPENKFNIKRIAAHGVVQLNPEFDFKYIYVPFSFAEELLAHVNRASFIDVTLTDDNYAMDVKSRLEHLLGNEYYVKTRVELNDILYKTNATEKWVTFFILSFILIVATFNLIGSLTMLIIDKRSDIRLLQALGTTMQGIRKVFLYEGLLITAVGASVGIFLGVLLVLIQQHIGFFPLEGGLVEYYPMELHLLDVAAVIAVVFVIGLVSSAVPVWILLREENG